MLKGAIFDLDGTLLDSMYAWDNSGARYLKTLGITAREDLEGKIVNMSIRAAATILKEDYDLTLSVEEIVEGIDKTMEVFYRDEVQAKPGVREMLEDFRSRGIHMVVASATDRYLIDLALERTGLRQYFERYFTVSEVGIGKEKPDIFYRAIEFMGITKDECMIFEDAHYAAETAVKYGIPLATVADRSEKDQELMKKLGNIYIEDFRKIRRIEL